MKRLLRIFAAGVAFVIIVVLIPLIFTEQREGGKLTSWRVVPAATEGAKPIGAGHNGKQ
jgi:hypothetical protein